MIPLQRPFPSNEKLSLRCISYNGLRQVSGRLTFRRFGETLQEVIQGLYILAGWPLVSLSSSFSLEL
jgi:hypothetical protein